jgi:hypothetical protein
MTARSALVNYPKWIAPSLFLREMHIGPRLCLVSGAHLSAGERLCPLASTAACASAKCSWSSRCVPGSVWSQVGTPRSLGGAEFSLKAGAPVPATAGSLRPLLGLGLTIGSCKSSRRVNGLLIRVFTPFMRHFSFEKRNKTAFLWHSPGGRPAARGHHASSRTGPSAHGGFRGTRAGNCTFWSSGRSATPIPSGPSSQ